MNFELTSSYSPLGDQPRAIKSLVQGLEKDYKHQTLLGVTGSGKTFTVANVIAKINKPTLVIAHNKTLAAQLAQEYRNFFPNNAVHYFVSYYDYYQPEAYVPTSDTYIEKEAQINAEIDKLRHATTQSLITRQDVIIVASVSCIYGLGSKETYAKASLLVKKGSKLTRQDLIKKLISIYFERTNGELFPGKFRAIGNQIDIMSASESIIYRVLIDNGIVQKITKINSITKAIEIEDLESFYIFAAKHFVSTKEDQKYAIASIQKELKIQLEKLKNRGKLLEHEKLRRRTLNDIALIREVGYCAGIENYSLHFDRRKVGDPPNTLLSYFPKDKNGNPDFLTIIDESHVTVPQIAGMYAGDRSRKNTLVEYGYRLPSAKDNRPLRFNEFSKRINHVLYTSATPAGYELSTSDNIVEQIIRPTGLLDPKITLKPIVEKGNFKGQVKDFIKETGLVIKNGGRVLVTTLTKKTAEELSSYLETEGIKAEYIHSDVKTLERIEILTNFRKGKFDCLVGVNLLREGLDLPEVELVAILDADKEGFLRSKTSLIQTIGRAARNSAGSVILYADNLTTSLKAAIQETERRRKIQTEYNQQHNITPTTIKKEIQDITEQIVNYQKKAAKEIVSIDMDLFQKNPKNFIRDKRKEMESAVKDLDFETAAIVRDEIRILEQEYDSIIK